MEAVSGAVARLNGFFYQMTRTLKIILNPFGGQLNRRTKISLVEQGLRQANLAYHLEVTRYPKHATELARQAMLEGYECIVAAGGDGTINEIINGILQTNFEQPCQLGILPIGSANDLANSLKIPNDINQACQRLAKGYISPMDVGVVNGHYFLNNSAIGLEPVVTMMQHQMRWINGIPRYIAAAIKSIIYAKTWKMRLSWPQGVYEGEVLLVSVGNGPRTGGVFFMTPDALLDDGQLDFVYGPRMARWQIFSIFPRLFNGSHLKHPLVILKRSTELHITTDPATPIQADGEIIDTAATEIAYQIISKKLQVIM